jgi:hypothetical protein
MGDIIRNDFNLPQPLVISTPDGYNTKNWAVSSVG